MEFNDMSFDFINFELILLFITFVIFTNIYINYNLLKKVNDFGKMTTIRYYIKIHYIYPDIYITWLFSIIIICCYQ